MIFISTIEPILRDISGGTDAEKRMSVLPCTGSLQDGKLRRGKEVQWYVFFVPECYYVKTYDVRLSSFNRKGTIESTGPITIRSHRQRRCSRFVFPVRIQLTTDLLHLFSPEGYIGMALAGGAAALGTIVIASLIRRATRK